MLNKILLIINKKCKTFLIIACLLSANVSYSQKIYVFDKSELKDLPEGKKFAFIEPTTETSSIEFVATFLAKDRFRKSNIEGLYFAIRKKATKLGANCFKIKSFTRDSLNKEVVLILDCYVASDSVLNQNTDNHENNIVVVFGNERPDDDTVLFNVNGAEKKIRAGTYYKITLKINNEVLINKGGPAGETVRLNWGNFKPPAFYTLSGFGLQDLNKQPKDAIAFKTGSINFMGNISLGLLLMHLLEQGN